MPSASLLANPHLMCREGLPGTRISCAQTRTLRLKKSNVRVDHVIQVYINKCVTLPGISNLAPR